MRFSAQDYMDMLASLPQDHPAKRPAAAPHGARAVRASGKAKPECDPVFAGMLRDAGLPLPVAEHRFCERKWRFDLAWKKQRVAIEIQGGIWTQGKHSRGAGQENDYAKANRATVLGWKILYVTPEQLHTMETIYALKALLLTPIDKSPNSG